MRLCSFLLIFIGLMLIHPGLSLIWTGVILGIAAMATDEEDTPPTTPS
jgi:multisubunit Na+/H+ antiporter MnhC subunit